MDDAYQFGRRLAPGRDTDIEAVVGGGESHIAITDDFTNAPGDTGRRRQRRRQYGTMVERMNVMAARRIESGGDNTFDLFDVQGGAPPPLALRIDQSVDLGRNVLVL